MDIVFTGSDTLILNKFPKGTSFKYRIKILCFRILVRVLERHFIKRAWVVAEHLKDELNLKKPVMLIDYHRSSPDYNHCYRQYPKKEHEGFNVLYYFTYPKKNTVYHEWIYGYDIFIKLKDYFGKKVNWIIADGSQDMSKIYPVVDLYIRPNRHDGMPMMVKECIAQKIPFHWTREKPNLNSFIYAVERNLKPQKEE